VVLNLEYDLLISNLQVAFQLELFRWPTEKCDTYKSGALSLLICKPDEKSQKITWVGVRNFTGFIWIQPDLVSTAFKYNGSETLLQLEGT